MPESDNPDATALVVTWDHVLEPGSADYLPGSKLFEDLAFPVGFESGYSLPTACFLAAQSLLVYRPLPDRLRILERQGLRESYGEEIAGTLCSILEPAGSAPRSVPVTVVFRGTSHLKNWITNLQSLPTGWAGGGHVHGGFAAAYEEIFPRLAPGLERWAREGRPVHFTGHSLGGALATLSLSQYLLQFPSAPSAAYTFGSPRVGNAAFAESFASAPLFRTVNGQDLVTRLPLAFPLSRRLTFLHAGDAHFLCPGSGLQRRGPGDIAEEQASLERIKEFFVHAADAFKQSRPPIFLADHAPARYLERLQLAMRDSGWSLRDQDSCPPCKG